MIYGRRRSPNELARLAILAGISVEAIVDMHNAHATGKDLERIEAARAKRERKAEKRRGSS